MPIRLVADEIYQLGARMLPIPLPGPWPPDGAESWTWAEYLAFQDFLAGVVVPYTGTARITGLYTLEVIGPHITAEMLGRTGYGWVLRNERQYPLDQVPQGFPPMPDYIDALTGDEWMLRSDKWSRGLVFLDRPLLTRSGVEPIWSNYGYGYTAGLTPDQLWIEWQAVYFMWFYLARGLPGRITDTGQGSGLAYIPALERGVLSFYIESDRAWVNFNGQRWPGVVSLDIMSLKFLQGGKPHPFLDWRDYNFDELLITVNYSGPTPMQAVGAIYTRQVELSPNPPIPGQENIAKGHPFVIENEGISEHVVYAPALRDMYEIGRQDYWDVCLYSPLEQVRTFTLEDVYE